MVILTLAYYGIFRFIILKSFIELDTRYAEQNMGRCVSAFDREIKHLQKFVLDWSNWDDAYRFALDGNKEFIKANLLLQTYKDQNSISSISITRKADSSGEKLMTLTQEKRSPSIFPRS